MAQIAGRDLHLVKKALAIAVLEIERSPDTPFRSDSDMADMKVLLDRLMPSNAELAHCARASRIAVTSKPE